MYPERTRSRNASWRRYLPSEGVVCYAKATPWPFTFGIIAKNLIVVNGHGNRAFS